jgi:hypothetical protein
VVVVLPVGYSAALLEWAGLPCRARARRSQGEVHFKVGRSGGSDQVRRFNHLSSLSENL